MFPLTRSKEGEVITVRCIDCDCEDLGRLNELGCYEGASGTIISNQQNVILKVGESRLAIDNNLAQSILVSPN
jgi:Fe2+ transport system protein FeoA